MMDLSPQHRWQPPSTLPKPQWSEEKKQSQYPPQLFIEWEGGVEEVQNGEVAWGTRAVGPAWWETTEGRPPAPPKEASESWGRH